MTSSDELRARQLLNVGRHAEARDLTTAALAQDPDSAGLLVLLAEAVEELDGHAPALPHVERALALAPDDSDVHSDHGRLLSHLGRHDQSREALGRALGLSPTGLYPLAVSVEALLRDDRRRGHKERVQQAYSHAQLLIQTHPSQALSHLMMAKAQLANKQPRQAETSARTGLAIEPNNPVGLQLLGLANEAQGKAREAGDAYVSAAKADPTSSFGIDNLRRLGKGAALPIGGAVWLIFRLLSRVGRLQNRLGAIIAIGLCVAAVVGLLIYRFVIVPKRARGQLSHQARSVLELDESL